MLTETKQFIECPAPKVSANCFDDAITCQRAYVCAMCADHPPLLFGIYAWINSMRKLQKCPMSIHLKHNKIYSPPGAAWANRKYTRWPVASAADAVAILMRNYDEWRTIKWNGFGWERTQIVSACDRTHRTECRCRRPPLRRIAWCIRTSARLACGHIYVCTKIKSVRFN